MAEDYQGPTPPPELVEEWLRERPPGKLAHKFLATQAARWGADQELEACVEWVEREIGHGREWGAELRAARRRATYSAAAAANAAAAIDANHAYAAIYAAVAAVTTICADAWQVINPLALLEKLINV